MIRFKLCVVLFVVCAQASAGDVFFESGADLHDWYQAGKRVQDHRGNDADFSHSSMFAGYVTAVHDGASDVCSPEGTTRGQLEAVAGLYLEQHPEEWNKRGITVVHTALLKAFPCAAK